MAKGQGDAFLGGNTAEQRGGQCIFEALTVMLKIICFCVLWFFLFFVGSSSWIPQASEKLFSQWLNKNLSSGVILECESLLATYLDKLLP